MTKKYRYLIVRIEDVKVGYSSTFAEVRKNLHEFSKDSGINLADAGTSVLKPEQQAFVENAFDRAMDRAKEITRLIKKENNEDSSD